MRGLIDRKEVIMRYINRPFTRLKLKERGIFILHLAGFSYRDIAKIVRTSKDTVTRYVNKGYREYPTLNKDK